MTPSEPEEILAVPALEITHMGGPGLAAEGLAEGDELAALLTDREAGGAAVRGGALRVVGYVVNALLGAVAAAFLFRHLGKAGAGTYVTALTIAAIVAGLSDLGLTALGLRELSVRDPDSRARLMSNLLGLRISLTLIGILGSVIFAIAVGYSSLLISGVALAGAGLMFQTAQSTLGLSLMSRLRLGLLTAWLVHREVPLLPHFDRAEWLALGREVLPYSVAVALAVIYFRLSVIVVSLTASATQLSNFGVSFRVLEVLIVIPGLMVTGVFPIFARSAIDDHVRFAYAVSRVFVVALIVGVWFALALALGAPLAVKVIGGGKFGGAVDVLRIQAVGLGGSFVSAVWGLTLISLRRNRELMLVNLSGLIIGTLLVLFLASSYGAEGAAAGTAVTEVFFAAAVPLVLVRTDRHVVPSMQAVPRVALAGALACIVALIPGVPTLAMVIVSSLTYFTVLTVTHTIPDEVFVELRNLAISTRQRLTSHG